MTRRLDIQSAAAWGSIPVFWLALAAWLMPAGAPQKFAPQAARRSITAVCFQVEGEAQLKCIHVSEQAPAAQTNIREPLL